MSGASNDVQSIANCRVCQRNGLPIMPLRYAVTRTDGWDQAGRPPGPEIPGNLADSTLAATPLPEGQRYTLRLLRAGYLYVFNELRGRWMGHVVTDKGYLIEYVNLPQDEVMAIDPESPQPIDGRLQPPPDEQEFACAANPDHAYPGRCIMIPNADRADTIYLAFSDVAWTKRVWKEHATNENGRRDAMRRISLAEWRGGSTQYADALDKMGDYLAEANYHWTPLNQHGSSGTWGRGSSGSWENHIGTAFDFSPFSLNGIQDRVEGLQRWADEQAEPLEMTPMLVGLEDPVGITSDIASLMRERLKEKMTDPAQARPLAISSVISNIRQSIREDAENRQIYRTEREAYQLTYGGPGAGGVAMASLFSSSLREQQQEMLERWKNPTPSQLTTARDDAWDDYTDKLDMSRLQSWERGWQKEMNELDTKQLAPLAQAHAKWMESDLLYECLNAQCDDRDSESGEAFVNVLLLCIQDTQEYAPCAALYQRWLSATTIEQRNLVLRALGYNQSVILSEWEGHAGGGLTPESLQGLPWTGLISGYENAIKAVGDGSQNAVIRLTAALGGPFAKLAATAVDNVVGPALVAMGVIARSPVVMVDVTMSRANAIAELTARMMALNPEVGSLDDLNRAIDIQMRKARIYGTPVEGTGRHRYLILADPRVVEDFPGVDAGGNVAPRRFAEEAILTEADRRAMTRLRWRRLLPTEAGLGVVAGIFQCIALGKLADDLDNSMAHEENENQWRHRTGIAALAGTLAETVGKWSEKASQTGSRLGQAVERYVGRFLRFVGRGIGIGTGVVMAVWDGIRGWQEIQEGNAVGWLYVSSAIASAGAVFAFSGFGPLIFGASATGVGIVLVVLVIAIAVLIEIFKDNKIQDWMERCYFGKFDEDGRYHDPKRELNELKLALSDMEG